jgi:enamine deaminase RidA (YjgF/YER057c/UK114 family)
MTIHNPESIHPPVGNYSHGIAMPPNCRVLYVAGQTGIRPDGTTPDSFEEQCHVVWRNIKAIVEDAGMRLTDIVRLTVLLTDVGNLAQMAAVRKLCLGDHKPAVTGFAVKSLVRPERQIEIDAIAMKPVAASKPAARKPAKKAAKHAIRRKR